MILKFNDRDANTCPVWLIAITHNYSSDDAGFTS